MGRPEAGYIEPVSKAMEITSGPSTTLGKLRDNKEGIY